MDTRLKQQIQFIVEVDKVKEYFQADISCGCKQKKRMTQNIPGICAYGSTFKGLHERRGKSDEGDDHGSDS